MPPKLWSTQVMKQTVDRLLEPLGDLKWMVSLRSFLVSYTTELKGEISVGLRPKASDKIFNAGLDGSPTEEHKDLFRLVYRVWRATPIPWEAITKAAEWTTFIKHSLVDALRIKKRSDILSIGAAWSLRESLMNTIDNYLDKKEIVVHWRDWDEYDEQPPFVNTALSTTIPSQYKGETLGKAMERTAVAPAAASAVVKAVSTILDAVKTEYVGYIDTANGRLLDPSLANPLKRFLTVSI
jgi:hypothetical protein